MPVCAALEQRCEGAEQLVFGWIRLYDDDVGARGADLIRVRLSRWFNEHGGWRTGKGFCSKVKIEGTFKHHGHTGSIMAVPVQGRAGRKPRFSYSEPIQLE